MVNLLPHTTQKPRIYYGFDGRSIGSKRAVRNCCAQISLTTDRHVLSPKPSPTTNPNPTPNPVPKLKQKLKHSLKPLEMREHMLRTDMHHKQSTTPSHPNQTPTPNPIPSTNPNPNSNPNQTSTPKLKHKPNTRPIPCKPLRNCCAPLAITTDRHHSLKTKPKYQTPFQAQTPTQI